MSTALWIFLVVAAAAASALLAFRIARRGAPTREQLQALEHELESARGDAEQVQAKVAEHFEKSALLFGQLADDYRAFLEHFSDSAQALGLPERRARELLERGYRPLLTRESAAEVAADADVTAADTRDAAAVEATAQRAEMPPDTASADTVSAAESSSARVVDVDLGPPAQIVPEGERNSAEPTPAAAPDAEATRQQGGMR